MGLSIVLLLAEIVYCRTILSEVSKKNNRGLNVR